MRISQFTSATPASRTAVPARPEQPAEPQETFSPGQTSRRATVAKITGAGCVLAGGIAAARIAAEVASAPGVAAKVALGAGVVASAAAGLMAADFTSGVFHWAIDNYPNENTPLVGGIAKEFQNHHDTPSMDHVSVWENVAPAATAMVGPMAALAIFTPHPMLAAAGLAFTGGAVLAQASHRWSHMSNPPTTARVLQKLGISQTSANHAKHHTDPFDEYYCIVNGKFNPLLTRTNFWRKMEKGVHKITGAEPNSWKDPKVKALAMGEVTKAELLREAASPDR
ncbi:MAG: fatty acid desaturase CarF family protein [Vulcanimicrobiota bacterium]